MEELKRVSLKCPICGSSHSYTLTLKYDPVFGLLKPQTEPSVTEKRLVFTCPLKNIKFFAVIPIEVPGRLCQVSVGDG